MEGRLTILKNHRHQYILSFLFHSTEKIEPFLFEKALQIYPLFAGILIERPDQPIMLGDCYSELDLEGLHFRFSPQTFVQNHPEQSLKIYQQICSLASQKENSSILDLYCGFGITSLLLAKQGHRVTGIEYNPLSIQFAKENRSKNGLKDRVDFVQGDVEKALPHRLKEGKDLILVNPPRQGLSPKVRELMMKAEAKELLYVSCMPSTLARDLAEFCKQKYRIESVTIYDMFPQTAHVETLVKLTAKE
jgi:23S rRNA (uracil1939-C5)-methyltransferase